MRKRQKEKSISRFFLVALMLLGIASIIAASLWLRQSPFPPWAGNRDQLGANVTMEAGAYLNPDHIHVGDVFFLNMRVAYRDTAIQMRTMPPENILQAGPFDVLAVKKTTRSGGGVTVNEYQYALQALNVMPGGSYVVKFAPLQYSEGNAYKTLSLPDMRVDLVPRFLPTANPSLSGPYGKIATYDKFVQWGIDGIAVVLLCTGLAFAFVRMRKKSAVPVARPIDNLFLSFNGIDGTGTNPRRTLQDIEQVAISLAALQEVTALQLWQGDYPAYAGTSNPWEELWAMVARAYEAQSLQEDARNAYEILSELFAHYIAREEGR